MDEVYDFFFFFPLWVLLLVLSFSNLCLTQDHKDFLLGFVLEVLCLGPWSSLREFLFMVWEVAEFLLSVCPAGRRPSFFQMDIRFSCLVSFVEHSVFSPLNCLCTTVEKLLTICVGPFLDSILFHQTDVYSFVSDTLSLFLWLLLLIIFHFISCLFFTVLALFPELRRTQVLTVGILQSDW